MQSQDYWRKREQDNIKRLLKNDINYQKEIERIYAENLRNVEARIDSLIVGTQIKMVRLVWQMSRQ